MIAEVHQLKPKAAAINWMCSACGVDAGCNCGAPLMSKAQRAAEAIAANPHKSNRAIAEEAGLSEPTVRRARTASCDAVEDEPRVGLDGKQRRMPVRRAEDDEEEFRPPSIAERKASFLLFANEAMILAKYEGLVDHEILAAAKETASAWCRLVETMEKGK